MNSWKKLKPRVVVSRCIEFDYCRWNGMIIKNEFIKLLKNYVEFLPICPEFEIGLGIPRDPVRIVKKDGELRMTQSKTEKDLTNNMHHFIDEFFDSLKNIDGFLLKSQSPSCGIFQTKHYQSMEKGSPVLSRGSGIFGTRVMEEYTKLAIETEGRLHNFRIREHWLIKLYTLSRFREVVVSHSKYELVKLHSAHKLLFLAYNQILMREMGRIVANPSKLRFEQIIKDYEAKLSKLLEKPPNFTAHINVLMHALGYFSKGLKSEEKAYFLDQLDAYRAGWIPLFLLTSLLSSWIARFDVKYLKKQVYFNPYPEKLITFDLRDSWRGHSLWNKEKAKD
jgi:uncharacterized protein YbgA (DUF1722 family)/uncharacterized protein YbbK (DUF523 family)